MLLLLVIQKIWQNEFSIEINTFCLDKTTTSPKGRALVAYLVHVVWLNYTARRRRYLIDHGYGLLGFSLGWRCGGRNENIEGGADKSASRDGFPLLKVMPLEKLIYHISSTSSRKERVTVLKGAMRSVLEPLKNSSETGFEDPLNGGEVWSCI